MTCFVVAQSHRLTPTLEICRKLAIYARLNAKTYGSWVLKAQLASLSSIASRNLPQIDDGVHAAFLAQVAN